MTKLTCSLVLLALLGLWLVPTAANASPKFVVYWDADLSQRAKDSPGVGVFDEVFVVGEDFPAAFISGAQYAVDYGPHLTWVADVGLPPVSIGDSPTGLSMGFGQQPKPGGKFLIHSAVVIWNSECATALNANFPSTTAHPQLPQPTPIASRFPDFDIIPALAARSQSCQFVEMDIKPGGCTPAQLNIALWDFLENGKPDKGGKLSMTILGSSTQDAFQIDQASINFGGAGALSFSFGDVGVSAGPGGSLGAPGCFCASGGSDGFVDLEATFNRQDIAAGIPRPEVGDVVPVTISGTYVDGLPFTATDCVVIVGQPSKKNPKGGAPPALGFPNPNPFNPVTRISYSVPTSQHVSIAIYDVAGRLIEHLVNEVKGAGEYVVEWNAGGLPSGVYFYRMQTGSETIVRRATLLK